MRSLEDSNLGWLHISDFHFRNVTKYDSDQVTGALIDSLPALTARLGKPDFVVASGDIAYSGKSEEYCLASIFFDDLLAKLQLARDKLVVIPGNHDVDRTKSIGLVRTLSDSIEAQKYFSQGTEIRHLAAKQAAFRSWYDEYFHGIKSLDVTSTCQKIEVFTLNERRVRVLPINSAAFCFDDNDSGKLFIGRPCVELACKLMSKKAHDADLDLVVLHHPFGWLHQSEVAQVKSALRERFDCILTGHLHSTDIEDVHGLNGQSLHLAAGATYQTDDFPKTAMFCGYKGGKINVAPIRYEDAPRPCWTIDPSIYPGEPNFQKAYDISTKIAEPEDRAMSKQSVAANKSSLLDNLLTSPTGESLYVEPRTFDRPQILPLGDEDTPANQFDVEQIVQSGRSFFILAKSEYGGTTFGRRVESDIVRKGDKVAFQDARKLPNYRKKLEKIFDNFVSNFESANTLILDNFDLEQDERLLKEIEACRAFGRIIVIVPDRGLEVTVPSEEIGFMKDRIVLHLWSLSREGIRELASIVFRSDDQVFISEIVAKVYNDLLSLCIPLTPNNVIMYLRVLFREGKYVPINRVDIVDKYLQEILQSPGEAYGRDINVKNKMDILAAFVYKMYQDEVAFFDNRYWYDFISRYQENALFEFDGEKLLRDLFVTRIFFRINDVIAIRYAFYFDFYLGRYLASRQSLLDDFIKEEEYLKVDGVIEVITGLSSNNGSVLDRLTARGEELLDEFAKKYTGKDFDIIRIAKWVDQEDEQDRVWKPVAIQIEAGPRQASEVDAIKSSFIAEARTGDQKVKFAKFVALENALFAVGRLVKNALRNCDDVDGEIKARAYRVVASSSLVAYQVGTMLTPHIATRRYLQWGGVSFFDFHRAAPEKEGLTREERYFMIVRALCSSISLQDAEEIATIKLSPVFKQFARQTDGNSYFGIFSFMCILYSKGQGWEAALQSVIEKTDKNALYLLLMLSALLRQMRDEFLQSKDREAIKRLIALLQAKRLYGKQMPGSRAVDRVARALENKYPPFANSSPKSGDKK